MDKFYLIDMTTLLSHIHGKALFGGYQEKYQSKAALFLPRLSRVRQTLAKYT
jgi:hypothetical protein